MRAVCVGVVVCARGKVYLGFSWPFRTDLACMMGPRVLILMLVFAYSSSGGKYAVHDAGIVVTPADWLWVLPVFYWTLALGLKKVWFFLQKFDKEQTLFQIYEYIHFFWQFCLKTIANIFWRLWQISDVNFVMFLCVTKGHLHLYQCCDCKIWET